VRPLAAAALALVACGPAQDRPAVVTATVETDPVPSSGDAADDPALWVHPADPARSAVLGDDKQGGLLVYGLDGRQLQHLDAEKDLNNVDVRYGFPLAGKFADGAAHDRVDVAAVGNETDSSIYVYKIHPVSGKLERAGEAGRGRASVYGGCMYRSPRTGKYYYFATGNSGSVQQWELRDDGRGGIEGALVRELKAASTVEGAVADDVHAKLYVGEEERGIWKYGAEPGDGDARDLVDRCGRGGRLTADVEGLAIYSLPDGTGYLLASSQGNDSYVVYRREGENAYVGTFRIGHGRIDGTEDTDGIDVTSAALGPAFPRGLFVAQDGRNPGANQNYKLVPWESIAGAFQPPLRIDSSWTPRPK
jgi:3-phytase